MRRVVSGQFELSVPAEKAIGFLTPEGERDWVPGWNPIYPAGEPTEESGTVFTTDIHGVETVWLIQEIDRTRRTAAYFRVTPGRNAGTVHVRCDDVPDSRCVVTVTYDMSLLPGSDTAGLDAYDDAPFEAMMSHWADVITNMV